MLSLLIDQIEGISRKSMDTLLKTRVPIARKAVMHLLRSFIDYACQIRIVGLDVHWFLTGNVCLFRSITGFMHLMLVACHSSYCGRPMAKMGRDVDEDCPFPSGVNRVWDRDFPRSKVVWKKTGEEYGRQPAQG
ncbi:hypothetical protein M408DRAFT_161719 [Serendipita vermifera MAFF 305830]|uniref:Uncharacterized protein n=1 Tax=Serendipita vermifera MAFF 305830 TaxID=933852 RepID=A0A0C2WR77_SERVB|nr:hypothetical protein M408DRAFT_161719 [Serendipita vermifera MAFF 305830]